MINLTPAVVARILGFVGYGNPNAPVWFIGLEEGLSEMDDTDIPANLAARGRFDEVMDLSNAHLSLVEAGLPYDLSLRQSFTPVWLWMARFARATDGATDWQDLDLAKDYIRTRLGRLDGQTFLTYTAPIPEKGLHTREWTTLLEREGPQMRVLLDRRRAKIRQMIEQHRPSIVICHGRSASAEYRSLLPDGTWQHVGENASFQMCQDAGGSRCYISPFFGVGQMSFALAEEFVRLLRQNSLVATSEGADHHRVAPRPAVTTIRAPGHTNMKSGREPDWGAQDATDPKQTIMVLDQLVSMGFDNNAFWRLHHKRKGGRKENIENFRKYCERTSTFRQGETNQLVHERLVAVLQACLANDHPAGQAVDFVELAEWVWREIPPL